MATTYRYASKYPVSCRNRHTTVLSRNQAIRRFGKNAVEGLHAGLVRSLPPMPVADCAKCQGSA